MLSRVPCAIQQVLVSYPFKKKKKTFIYLAALGLSCGMWELVPRPGMVHGPSALGAWSLSHWTTREVPIHLKYSSVYTSIPNSITICFPCPCALVTIGLFPRSVREGSSFWYQAPGNKWGRNDKIGKLLFSNHSKSNAFTNQKMGRRPKQTFLQRRHTDG